MRRFGKGGSRLCSAMARSYEALVLLQPIERGHNIRNEKSEPKSQRKCEIAKRCTASPAIFECNFGKYRRILEEHF